METGSETPVRLYIRGETLGPEAEVVEQRALGTLCREGKRQSISYREELEGTRSTLLIWSGCVILRREGAYRSQLVFREGRRQLSRYETPYGSFPMAVYTRALSITPERGEIRADYSLELGETKTEHRISIRICPESPSSGGFAPRRARK